MSKIIEKSCEFGKCVLLFYKDATIQRLGYSETQILGDLDAGLLFA